MPGILNPDSLCHMCGTNLDALVDESGYSSLTHSPYIKREYYHRKLGSSQSCKRTFLGHKQVELAKSERWLLETHPKGSPTN